MFVSFIVTQDKKFASIPPRNDNYNSMMLSDYYYEFQTPFVFACSIGMALENIFLCYFTTLCVHS